MWRKGQSGNPKGKPKSDFRKMMDAALTAESKAKGISLIRHAVKQAYKDNAVLVAILRKVLPDLKAVDAKINEASPFKLIIDFSRSDTKTDKSSKKTQKRS